MPGIVVSVDGSAASQRALEWAVTHAALEHAPLTVLAVHRVAASAWTGNPVIYPQDRARRAEGRARRRGGGSQGHRHARR